VLLAAFALLPVASCAEGTTADDFGTPTSTSGSSGTSGTGGGASSSGVAGNCSPSPAENVGPSCDAPVLLDNLVDTLADSTEVSGNGMPAGRELWLSFKGIDDIDTNGDEYHVDVRFLENPGNAYQMDVYRETCSDMVAAAETESFDWYTDFPTTDTDCTEFAPCGEGDCTAPPGEEGTNACEDNTADYFVRIMRSDGKASCEVWRIELSNGVY